MWTYLDQDVTVPLVLTGSNRVYDCYLPTY